MYLVLIVISFWNPFSGKLINTFKHSRRVLNKTRTFHINGTLGTLTSNDADGNENVKKTIGLISKTTTLHVHHAFLYISLPVFFLNMPNFAFYGGRKQATTKFYFSYCTWIWCLGIQFQEGSPTFDKVSG